MSTLAFIITSKCTEACTYCFRTQQRDTTLKEFQGLLARAIKDTPELTKVVITGGDPELNVDFWHICAEVKKQRLRLKIHGNYLNKKTWNKYATIADEISIPLDSMSEKKLFRSVKSVAHFKKVFDYFLKKNVGIQVHTVVSTANRMDILEILDFLKTKKFFDSEKNSWKMFRLQAPEGRGTSKAELCAGVGVNGLSELELTEKEWFTVKKRFGNKQTKFVDNVLQY